MVEGRFQYVRFVHAIIDDIFLVCPDPGTTFLWMHFTIVVIKLSPNEGEIETV